MAGNRMEFKENFWVGRERVYFKVAEGRGLPGRSAAVSKSSRSTRDRLGALPGSGLLRLARSNRTPPRSIGLTRFASRGVAQARRIDA